MNVREQLREYLAQSIPTFGGGRQIEGNPIASALADRPPSTVTGTPLDQIIDAIFQFFRNIKDIDLDNTDDIQKILNDLLDDPGDDDMWDDVDDDWDDEDPSYCSPDLCKHPDYDSDNLEAHVERTTWVESSAPSELVDPDNLLSEKIAERLIDSWKDNDYLNIVEGSIDILNHKLDQESPYFTDPIIENAVSTVLAELIRTYAVIEDIGKQVQHLRETVKANFPGKSELAKPEPTTWHRLDPAECNDSYIRDLAEAWTVSQCSDGRVTAIRYGTNGQNWTLTPTGFSEPLTVLDESYVAFPNMAEALKARNHEKIMQSAMNKVMDEHGKMQDFRPE